MSSNVVFNGTTYAIPADGDFGWGAQLTAFFIDIAGASFQKTGGAFTLTAEADFGATYGLKSAYFKSRAANPAAAGAIRLGNTETISWRNAANGADKALTVSASDVLTYGGTKVILSGSIVNADVDAAAAIAYSKLNLSGSIVNADVSASAAIAYSKLDLSDSIVNADIDSAAAIAYSKLNLATSIVNADISASAAIALSKLAAVTASRVLVSDGSGLVSASSVTATTLGYLDATSSIQTQIDAKAPSASPTFTGTVTVPATITGPSSRVFTFPSATATFATIGLSETLALKTLTSPQVNGLLLAKSDKTGNYTLLLTDDVVTCNATGGAFTITFPSAATSTNKIFVVKKTDSSFNAVTLSGTGMTTNYLMTVGETASFQSDGSAWIQIDRTTDTGWISHTPTGTWAANTTYSGLWRRSSDGIIMRGSVTLSGAPTGTQTINIVNSAAWTINTGKLYAAAQNDTLGDLSIFDTGTDNKIGKMGYSSATALAFLACQVSGSNVVRSAVTATVPQTFANGDVIYYETKIIPITNFSA